VKRPARSVARNVRMLFLPGVARDGEIERTKGAWESVHPVHRYTGECTVLRDSERPDLQLLRDQTRRGARDGQLWRNDIGRHGANVDSSTILTADLSRQYVLAIHQRQLDHESRKVRPELRWYGQSDLFSLRAAANWRDLYPAARS
jgi:hypothetical protein